MMTFQDMLTAYYEPYNSENPELQLSSRTPR